MKENIAMKKEPMVMTLCGRCLSQFYFANCYRICRKDECQCIKEDCTYCGCRKGYDYCIYPKRNRIMNSGHHEQIRGGRDICCIRTAY